MPSPPPTLRLVGSRATDPSSGSSSGSDTGAGRSLAAARTFAPGDAVAEFGASGDSTIAIPHSSHLAQTCSWCLVTGAAAGEAAAAAALPSLQTCAGCRTVYYCGAACQRADWTRGGHGKGECKAFRRVRDEGHPGLPTPVRALVRMLVVEAKAKAKGEDGSPWRDLDGHAAAFRGHQGGQQWKDLELQAMAALHYLGRDASTENVAGAIELLCKSQINSFNRLDMDIGQTGLFLDPALAMVNHSCVPNAFIRFLGRKAVLIAYQEIKKGDEVNISYIENTLHRSERQKALQERYHFACRCARCAEDLDVYQVCQKYPHLELNRPSLKTDLSELRHPSVIGALSGSRVLRESVSAIYGECSASLEGLDLAEKRRRIAQRWAQCRLLREGGMYAVEPLNQVLVEASIYFSERGMFYPALVISSFLALECDPYRAPVPFAPARVKTLLMMAKILTNTADGEAVSEAGMGPGTAKISRDVAAMLDQAQQIRLCHALLTLVVHCHAAEHWEGWPVLGEAKQLLAMLEEIAGEEASHFMVEMVRRSPSELAAGVWFEKNVVDKVRSLHKLGLPAMEAEFGS